MRPPAYSHKVKKGVRLVTPHPAPKSKKEVAHISGRKEGSDTVGVKVAGRAGLNQSMPTKGVLHEALKLPNILAGYLWPRSLA